MTTEQKHTSGVISIDRHGAAWINGGRMLLTGIQIPASSGPRMDEAEANLLRMAACWNACEGIDTETIEAILANKSSLYIEWTQKAEQVIEFKKERDAIAAKVKELEKRIDDDGFEYADKLHTVTAQRDELVAVSKSLLYALSVGAKSRNYQSELEDLITKIEAGKQNETE